VKHQPGAGAPAAGAAPKAKPPPAGAGAAGAAADPNRLPKPPPAGAGAALPKLNPLLMAVLLWYASYAAYVKTDAARHIEDQCSSS
jgi:hypothetical protein